MDQISLTLAVVGSEWLASRLSLFNLSVKIPCTHRFGGWVYPSTVLDSVEKRKS
jgi:hypothetical protein